MDMCFQQLAPADQIVIMRQYGRSKGYEKSRTGYPNKSVHSYLCGKDANAI